MRHALEHARAWRHGNPWIAQEIGQEVEINRALDACHKAGIGLISSGHIHILSIFDEVIIFSREIQRSSHDNCADGSA